MMPRRNTASPCGGARRRNQGSPLWGEEHSPHAFEAPYC